MINDVEKLVHESFSQSACFTGLSPYKRDKDVPISFFNFACVRSRTCAWRDVARAVESVIERRRALRLPEGAWEYDDGQASHAASCHIHQGEIDDFIPTDQWLPDAHVRYGLCPVPYPHARHQHYPSTMSLSKPRHVGSSATLVSSNTRTYSVYLNRLRQRHIDLFDSAHHYMYTLLTLMLDPKAHQFIVQRGSPIDNRG